MKVVFLRHDAIADLTDNGIVLNLYALGNRMICVTCFFAIFTLLTLSGSEPTIFCWNTCTAVSPLISEGNFPRPPVDAWNHRKYWTLYILGFFSYIYIAIITF